MIDIFREPLNSAEDVLRLERRPLLDVMPVNTIYEALQIAANRCPEKLALRHIDTPYDSSPRDINFATYLTLVEQAANLFHYHSGKTSPVVAVIGPFLPETLIAMWGGAVAGRYVPINPHLSLEHVVDILNAAKATILVTAYDTYGQSEDNSASNMMAKIASLKKIFIYGGASGNEQSFNEALKESRTNRLNFKPASNGAVECGYMHTGGQPEHQNWYVILIVVN